MDFGCDGLIKRAPNFYWNYELFERQAAANKDHVLHLSILADHIFKFIATAPSRELSKQDLLEKIVRQIYLVYKAPDTDLKLFGNNSPHGAEVYRAYFFSTLCAFLNSSRRIKGMSINEFIVENDTLEKNFLSQMGDEAKKTKQVSTLASQRRKARNRALQKNAVYPKRPQWAAISKDIVHESTFQSILTSDDDTMRYFLPDVDDPGTIRLTYKRFGNLYNEIHSFFDLPEDDRCEDQLKAAYQKFLSRRSKIKYGDYLKLQRAILSHITADKEYYGLNLYRFERKLKLYNTVYEIKCLAACGSIAEEYGFLMQSVILQDITFPKLYKSFASTSFPYSCRCAEAFPEFLQDITISSCIILDDLVEKGAFGNDWQMLFRNTLNEMAEDVLYDPSQIDFTVQEGDQERFEKLLAAPVFSAIRVAATKEFGHFDPCDFPL